MLGRGGGKHSPPPECQRHKTSTHLASTSALHRGAAASLLGQSALSASASYLGAAASLLGQSELHGGFAGAKANTCRCVDGTQTSPPQCHEQKTSTHLESAAPALHRRAAASLLYKSTIHGSSTAQANSCRCLVVATASTLLHHSARGRRRARNLSLPPPPCTMEPPQAHSISRSSMAASLSWQTPANAWSWRRQALSTTGVPEAQDEHAPCVHLRLASRSSRKLARSVGAVRLRLIPWSSRKLARSVGAPWRLRGRKGKHLQVRQQDGTHSPPPQCQRQKTSTHLESAAPTLHRRAAASLLDQSGVCMTAPLQWQTPAGAWSWRRQAISSTRVPEADDEHAPRVRLRLASWSSRKLARSVGAPWRHHGKSKHLQGA